MHQWQLHFRDESRIAQCQWDFSFKFHHVSSSYIKIHVCLFPPKASTSKASACSDLLTQPFQPRKSTIVSKAETSEKTSVAEVDWVVFFFKVDGAPTLHEVNIAGEKN